MHIAGPNKNEIVFSRSSKDIIVTDIPAGRRFEVYFNYNGSRFGFEAAPYGGRYVLQLSDLLRSLERNSILPEIPDSGFIKMSPEILDIEFCLESEAPVTFRVHWLPGYCNNAEGLAELMNSGFWWTFRKQCALTYEWGTEILETVLPDKLEPAAAVNTSALKVSVAIWFEKAGKVILPLVDIPFNTASDERLVAIDVSFKKISDLALRNKYESDRIFAYDVTGSINGKPDLPIAQRFVLAPKDRNVRGWLFRNSLGAFDTIYSFGQITRAIESESETFRISRKEIELKNISTETWSVDTGYIMDGKILDSWFEFLRSSERYILVSGCAPRRVIVDDQDAKNTLHQAGNISFRCRLSEDQEGYDFFKSKLEDFSPGFT